MSLLNFLKTLAITTCLLLSWIAGTWMIDDFINSGKGQVEFILGIVGVMTIIFITYNSVKKIVNIKQTKT